MPSAKPDSRILLYSHRSLYPNVLFRLGIYEFEDVVRQIDAVDLLEPCAGRFFEHGTRVANKLATSVHMSVNPGVVQPKVERDYDLFFMPAQFARDLLHVKYLDGWKQRCKVSICWLDEFWIPDLQYSSHYLQILSEFDYVILPFSGSVDPLQQVIGKPCSFMPYAIDTLRFCPYPENLKRVIDVYSIGRRSEVTHQALLNMANANKLFYVYDTIKGSHVPKPAEHRALLPNILKRSRYFIVNPGKVDVRGETGGQIEFGNRFFEGAASGALMIGETPRNENFAKAFDWADAVIDVPFDSDAIATAIEEMDRQPERQAAIRTNNVAESLRRHDWAYRWESILATAGLRPLPALEERKSQLAERAFRVVRSAVDSRAGA